MSKYGVTGLTNIGNTCFMNSVIQCLIHIPEFTKYIIKSDTVIADTPEADLFNKWKILNTELWKGHTTVKPQSFAQSLVKQPSFGNIVIGDQCDAHEFAVFLLDALHRAKSTPKSFSSSASAADVAWARAYAREHSTLVEMMHGQYSIQRHGKCGHTSTTYDPYGTIILPIPMSAAGATLNECFAAFVRPELMADAANLWHCDACATGVVAHKQFQLWRLPPILMITLKRFNGDMMKNNTRILFDDELDLAEYCNTDAETKLSTKYKLIGFTNHFGGMAGGHYTATCRNIDGKWYYYDDASVSHFVGDLAKFQASVYTMFWQRL